MTCLTNRVRSATVSPCIYARGRPPGSAQRLTGNTIRCGASMPRWSKCSTLAGQSTREPEVTALIPAWVQQVVDKVIGQTRNVLSSDWVSAARLCLQLSGGFNASGRFDKMSFGKPCSSRSFNRQIYRGGMAATVANYWPLPPSFRKPADPSSAVPAA